MPATSWAAAHGDNGGHSRKDQTIHPRDRKSFPAPPLSPPQLTNAARSSLEHTSLSLSPPTPLINLYLSRSRRDPRRCRLLLCGGLRKLVHDGLLSTNLYGEELKPKVHVPELRSYSWTTRHLAPTLYMRIFLKEGALKE